MHKRILSLILVLVVLFTNSMCYAVEETNTTSTNNKKYQLIIEDDADLLTESEETALKEEIDKLTEYGNIIFKSINTNPNYTTEAYAKSYYNNRFGSQSGTVFLIDMQKRNIYIFSNGSNYKTITNEKAEVITDNIYTYASKKQYYKCASEAFSQIYTLLQGGKIAEPMKYISNAVISVMLALLINFTIFKLATRNKAASGNEQIKECERFFENSTPIVKQTGEHKIYSPVEMHSSGGHGGGFSGGGRRRRPAEEATASKTIKLKTLGYPGVFFA